MKGNEARVVFFLHAVDQLKDGQVSKVKPLRRSFAVSVLLLLGLLLGLGVLIFVLLQFGVQTRSQQEPVSAFSDATTESPERSTEVPFPEPEVPDTERIGESEPEQIDQSRRNDSTMAIEQPTEIIRPGITYDSLSQTQMKQLSSKNTPHQIYHLQWPQNWRDLLHGCSTPWLHPQVSCWPILPSSS